MIKEYEYISTCPICALEIHHSRGVGAPYVDPKDDKCPDCDVKIKKWKYKEKDIDEKDGKIKSETEVEY